MVGAVAWRIRSWKMRSRYGADAAHLALLEVIPSCHLVTMNYLVEEVRFLYLLSAGNTINEKDFKCGSISTRSFQERIARQ